MTSPKATGTLRVNVYALLEDGIDGPLRAGLARAYKHSDSAPSFEETERLIQQQHTYLMNWFSEVFLFDE